MNPLPSWLHRFNHLKILKSVATYEYLRQWSLSEVVRLTLMDGQTVIAKMGRGSTSNELTIYNDLLIPFQIEIPTIYESYQGDSINLILMEDLGTETVETDPTASNFHEAVRQLARIRLTAHQSIQTNPGIGVSMRRHVLSQEQYLEDLDFSRSKLAPQRSDWSLILREAKQVLLPHLEKLYQECPLTLTHNDYHSKNLMVKGNRIIPIDWSNAYLSPHLGDLYCIIEEAKDYKIKSDDLINAYRTEIEKHVTIYSKPLEWQIQIGGLCWEIRSLRWVLEFGISAIAEAKAWIPSFLSGIQTLCNQLESDTI